MEGVDVIGFGAVAVDYLVVVERYPDEDSRGDGYGMDWRPGGQSGIPFSSEVSELRRRLH